VRVQGLLAQGVLGADEDAVAGLADGVPVAIADVSPTPSATDSAAAEPTDIAISLRRWSGRR
jgi:hypothetical protein